MSTCITVHRKVFALCISGHCTVGAQLESQVDAGFVLEGEEELGHRGGGTAVQDVALPLEAVHSTVAQDQMLVYHLQCVLHP